MNKWHYAISKDSDEDDDDDDEDDDDDDEVMIEKCSLNQLKIGYLGVDDLNFHASTPFCKSQKSYG